MSGLGMTPCTNISITCFHNFFFLINYYEANINQKRICDYLLQGCSPKSFILFSPSPFQLLPVSVYCVASTYSKRTDRSIY